MQSSMAFLACRWMAKTLLLAMKPVTNILKLQAVRPAANFLALGSTLYEIMT